MEKDKIALFLVNESNDYQQMLKTDVLSTAERAGLSAEIFFSDGRITEQIKQLYSCIHVEARTRPLAIIVMPVRDNSLNRVAHDAAEAGIGWICLQRRMDYLQELRQEFPNIPISVVSPDQREIGRIQGRQFRALLPGGGQMLYVQGSTMTSSAVERLEGMREAIKGTNIEVAGVLDGNWTSDDAERVVSGWLRIVLSGKSRLGLIGCQNDMMAVGARKALEAVANHVGRPEVVDTPITGCDGLVNFGQKLVNQRQLAATIIMPSTGGPAVDMVVRAIRQGTPTPPQLILQSTSYPDEKTLGAAARTP